MARHCGQSQHPRSGHGFESSKDAEQDLVAFTQRLSPEERVKALVEHCRSMMDLFEAGGLRCLSHFGETRRSSSASGTRLRTWRGRSKQSLAFEANEPPPRAHGQAPIIEYFSGLLIELGYLGIEFLFRLSYATLPLHHPTPLRPNCPNSAS